MKEARDALEIIFAEAASIERMLPYRDISMMRAKASWPDYLYDEDDRKDQEPEFRKMRPTAAQIDMYEMTVSWLRLLTPSIQPKWAIRKKIIWLHAYGYSYRDIAMRVGMPPKTVERWYKYCMHRLVVKLRLKGIEL